MTQTLRNFRRAMERLVPHVEDLNRPRLDALHGALLRAEREVPMAGAELEEVRALRRAMETPPEAEAPDSAELGRRELLDRVRNLERRDPDAGGSVLLEHVVSGDEGSRRLDELEAAGLVRRWASHTLEDRPLLVALTAAGRLRLLELFGPRPGDRLPNGATVLLCEQAERFVGVVLARDHRGGFVTWLWDYRAASADEGHRMAQPHDLPGAVANWLARVCSRRADLPAVDRDSTLSELGRGFDPSEFEAQVESGWPAP